MQEEKERVEKEMVDVESTSPPSIYAVPPFDVAVQEVNLSEESVCVYEMLRG